MLQNKIYLNFIKEISKTFIVILFGLSLIALTVRAVNFLDLIVDSGYSVGIYFKYSLLNLFGLMPKFIPLSFLLTLTIFILKHLRDSEFIILWTSGVKKIQIVNLFFLTSILILIFYLTLSTFITPYALNKSRQLLSNDELNSFLPTVRSHKFSDSFKGFTFLVEKKFGNEIQNIFLYDDGNNLKNFSSNVSKASATTIIAESGIIEKRNMFLFNGQIISTKKENKKNEVIKFEQLNINLGDLTTTTIKKPKLQETSTYKLFNCLISSNYNNSYCKKDSDKEIIPALNRRLILPLYIPILSLICSLLLIKTKKKYFNKFSIFVLGLLLIVFTELSLRYTGLNNFMKVFFIFFPFILFFIFYPYLIFKFSNESKKV